MCIEKGERVASMWFCLVPLCSTSWAPGAIRKRLALSHQQVGVKILNMDWSYCLSAIVSATLYPNFVVNRLKFDVGNWHNNKRWLWQIFGSLHWLCEQCWHADRLTSPLLNDRTDWAKHCLDTMWDYQKLHTEGSCQKKTLIPAGSLWNAAVKFRLASRRQWRWTLRAVNEEQSSAFAHIFHLVVLAVLWLFFSC